MNKKIHIILLLICFGCSVKDENTILNSNVTLSSPPTVEWAKEFGSLGRDISISGLITPEGDIIIVGNSDGNKSTDKSENSKDFPVGSANDIWVVKISKTGTIIWDKTIGGDRWDSAKDIIATSDGGYIIVAESSSGANGDKSKATTDFGRDFWIIKINSVGNIMWENTLGKSGTHSPKSIIATSDGSFVILGDYESYTSLGRGDKSDDTKGGRDLWIVKINSQGQKIWDKTIGGEGNEYGSKIINTSDNGFLIAAYSTSYISEHKSEKSFGKSDFWIVKLDINGSKIWDKTFGGSEEDYAHTISPTPDGGFLIGGDSFSGTSGNKTDKNRGDGTWSDYWIIKVNGIGQKVWDKTIGGEGPDYLSTIIPYSDGTFLLAGSSGFGVSFEKTDNQNGLWCVKINSEGVKIWDKSITDFQEKLLTNPTKDVYYGIGTIFKNEKYQEYKVTKLKF
jgi:hypothetical protein